MSRNAVTTVKNLYRSAVQSPAGFAIFSPDSHSPFTVWAVIRGKSSHYVGSESEIRLLGPNHEFVDAEFIVRIDMDENIPQGKAPMWYVCSENSVCEVDKHSCINIGAHHAENFMATLGIFGFVKAIHIAFDDYPELKGGLHLIYGSTNVEEKKAISKKSKTMNWKSGVRTETVDHRGRKTVKYTGYKEVLQEIEKNYKRNVKQWLVTYRRDHEDKSLQGRIKNDDVRRMFEQNMSYISDLRWCPDPNYDYSSWSSPVDKVIKKFLIKQKLDPNDPIFQHTSEKLEEDELADATEEAKNIQHAEADDDERFADDVNDLLNAIEEIDNE